MLTSGSDDDRMMNSVVIVIGRVFFCIGKSRYLCGEADTARDSPESLCFAVVRVPPDEDRWDSSQVHHLSQPLIRTITL